MDRKRENGRESKGCDIRRAKPLHRARSQNVENDRRASARVRLAPAFLENRGHLVSKLPPVARRERVDQQTRHVVYSFSATF